MRRATTIIGVPKRKDVGKGIVWLAEKLEVEYRVLSTFWTAENNLINWAYESTIKAIEFVNVKGIITNEEDVIRCINEGNKNLAKEIIEDYNLVEILK